MRTRLVSRRLITSLTAAIVLGTLVGLTTSAAPRGDPAPVDLSTQTGVGEHMLLVVAGEYTSEADARNAAETFSFGDMQGFYVDAATNYIVVGAYDQTSPDFRAVECNSLPQVTDACHGQLMRAEVPVSLAYIPIERIGAALEAADGEACGQTGQRPCMVARLKGLLVPPSYQFRADAYLVLTAFRTKKGAEEFVELARDRGYETSVVRARKTDGPYVGLGQEANPDGVSGPLIDPLPDPDSFQL